MTGMITPATSGGRGTRPIHAIERDLLDYAAWVAAMCGASAHLLVVPDAGVLHTFAPVARSIFARRGVEHVSMTAMIDRHIDELFEAVHTHGADVILTRPFSSRRSGRRAALRLWNDAPCSVWTVPCGSPPSVTRAFADISDETSGPLLLERAARLCRRAAANDLIVFRACCVDPASTPAFRWSDARRGVAGLLATCDLPLLQLRGERAHGRNEAAVRPWHGCPVGR